MIKRIAVLGAGVMGAQISAHFANAGFEVDLLDMHRPGEDGSGLAESACANLKRLTPSPIVGAEVLSSIRCGNYQDHLSRLQDIDLLIEAVTENLEIKRSLYQRIRDHLKPEAILATNTSGLSLSMLADAWHPQQRRFFCGIHFFNPPRYMRLVELVAASETDPALLDNIEHFLVQSLGKGVVRAKDTPNFIANRIGFFSIASILKHAQRLKLGFDVVDQLTGPLIGRAKSATYRTLDIVGLDTSKHVMGTLQQTLPQDPWRSYFVLPSWLDELCQKGHLGAKSRKGCYQKQDGQILVFDPELGDYRACARFVLPDSLSGLKLSQPATFLALKDNDHSYAQFLWSVFCDLWQYCAFHAEEIAFNVRDIDLAMRWGFAWRYGPFELWQAAGWDDVAQKIAAEGVLGSKGLKYPSWVQDGRTKVHGPEGSWSVECAAFVKRSGLAVYQRHMQVDALLGESLEIASKQVVSESSATCLWHTKFPREGLVLSFKTKMGVATLAVLEEICQAVEVAEAQDLPLVIWHAGPWCAGADLKEFLSLAQAEQYEEVDRFLAAFQRASMRLKHAGVAVVAAGQGVALGGGCELLMHCAHVILGLESKVGLVEPAVGVLPAGGGCKEVALRASQSPVGTLAFLKAYFVQICQAQMAENAFVALRRQWSPRTTVVLDSLSLLHTGLVWAGALQQSWHPVSSSEQIVVAGQENIAVLLEELAQIEGRSSHDEVIAAHIAEVLCGGEAQCGQQVSQQYLLDLERTNFIKLLKLPLSQARIGHLLKTGKTLKN